MSGRGLGWSAWRRMTWKYCAAVVQFVAPGPALSTALEAIAAEPDARATSSGGGAALALKSRRGSETRNILLDFLFSEDNRLLHLEDDVVFRELGHLPQAIAELPADWDILYLGANLICWNNGEPEPERYSEHLFRVRAAWTTHAVAYHKRCIRKVLEGQPSFDALMFDNWLSTRLPELNAFCVAPMVAWQRPRYSQIWKREDDYSEIFRMSEARLR